MCHQLPVVGARASTSGEAKSGRDVLERQATWTAERAENRCIAPEASPEAMTLHDWSKTRRMQQLIYECFLMGLRGDERGRYAALKPFTGFLSAMALEPTGNLDHSEQGARGEFGVNT